jgi:Fe-S-cluster containining protein
MGGASMACRPQCGACCIAPAISRPFYGMPEGKPAGVTCVHLTADARCALFGDPRRPVACRQFEPEIFVCGADRDEALALLTQLEAETAPRPHD